MALEKRWLAVSQLFTADGTNQGIITIASTLGFFAKQQVYLLSGTQPQLSLEIKRVNSSTQLQVAPVDSSINAPPADVSAYLVADSATISASEQPKFRIKPDEIIQAVYSNDPAIAIRTLGVDPFGNPFSLANPIPVQMSGSFPSIVKISDGTNTLAVNPDGSINVTGGGGGSGGGTSAIDKATFTYGVSSENPIGGVFQDTLPTVAAGKTGAVRMTAQRGLHSNLRDSSGNELLGSKVSAASVPVVLASDQVLPLPTGAATAAKQPALGASGTPSGDVITIQGAPGMTAVKVDGSGVIQPVSGTVTANIGTTGGLALDASVTGLQVSQGSATTGQKGDLVQGATTTNAPTYTPGQTNPLSLDDAGNLRVSLKDTPSNTNPFKVDGSATVQPVSGAVTANIGTTGGLALDSSVTGLHVPQGSTTSGQTGELQQAAVVSTPPTYTPGQTDPITMDAAGNLRVSLKDSPANTNKFLVTADPITFAAPQHIIADSGTISTITNPVPTKEQPDSTSGTSPSNADSTAYESNHVIKASAGTLYSITGYNSNASDQFIQIHNATALPVDGSVPNVIFIARGQSNFSYSADKFGRFFSTGMVVSNSSTGPTKTIGVADCWFNCQFQ